jgi:hypothetical protein
MSLAHIGGTTGDTWKKLFFEKKLCGIQRKVFVEIGNFMHKEI